MNRARIGVAGTTTRHGSTEAELRELRPGERHVQRSHLAYGMDVTLKEAHLSPARTRIDVSCGRSPTRAKPEQRSEVADAMRLGWWAMWHFMFKSHTEMRLT